MVDLVRIAAVAAAALCFAGGALAEPTVKPSKSFTVGASETSFARAVVGLKNGGALYAFAEGQDILVRPVSSDRKGRPSTSLTSVGRSEFGVQQAAMARLKNGDVVTAWVARPGPANAIFARVTTGSGGYVSAELPVSSEEFAEAIDVSVAALAEGGFAVSWISATNDGDQALNARAFTSSGVPVGFPAKIGAPEGVIFGGSSAAAYGSGFIVVYARKGSAPGVMAQRFSARAKPQDAATRLDRKNDLVHERARITARIGGGFAVVWQENLYSSAGGLPVVADTTLVGRFLDQGGVPAGDFAVEDPIKLKSLERSPVLTDTSAGLLVAWHVSKPDVFNDNDVRGALIAASGTAGPVTVLTKTSAATETLPQLGRLSDGRAALGFTARQINGDADRHGAIGAFLAVSP